MDPPNFSIGVRGGCFFSRFRMYAKYGVGSSALFRDFGAIVDASAGVGERDPLELVVDSATGLRKLSDMENTASGLSMPGIGPTSQSKIQGGVRSRINLLIYA